MHQRFAAGELLYGCRAVADYLGIKPRQALYLIEAGRLPVFREGRTICTRRSTLDAWLAHRDATARTVL